jgi:hypothetical protein
MIFLPFLSLYSNPEAAGERKPVHYTPRERERKGEAAENLPGLIVQKTELTQEKKRMEKAEKPLIYGFFTTKPNAK